MTLRAVLTGLFWITRDAAGNVFVVGNTRDEGQDVDAMEGVILKVNPGTGSVTETHFDEATAVRDGRNQLSRPESRRLDRVQQVSEALVQTPEYLALS
jgi:hypothetical protein